MIYCQNIEYEQNKNNYCIVYHFIIFNMQILLYMLLTYQTI